MQDQILLECLDHDAGHPVETQQGLTNLLRDLLDGIVFGLHDSEQRI